MTPPTFPSQQIAQEYLNHAAPESVYAWLKSNSALVASWASSPLSTPLLIALLERNDPIINLGLANVTTDDKILQTLWHLNNAAIRIAIAENTYRDEWIFSGPRWIEEANLSKALEEEHIEFVQAWCTNPSLKHTALADLFSKNKIYDGLSEERWLLCVYWGLKNPNLQKAPSLFDQYDDAPFQSAWQLLETLPNTRKNAYLICESFNKLACFRVPSWGRDELMFLEHILNRWSADASDDTDARSSDGEERSEFQILRKNIAKAIPAYPQTLRNFLRDHKDLDVRRGFYESERVVNPADLQTYFNKDGQEFLGSAVYNEHLYAAHPDGIRTAFRRLIENHPIYEADYPRPSFPRIWDHWAKKLFKEDPTLYPDPDIWENEESTKADHRDDETQESHSGHAPIHRRKGADWRWSDIGYPLLIISGFIALMVAWTVIRKWTGS